MTDQITPKLLRKAPTLRNQGKLFMNLRGADTKGYHGGHLIPVLPWHHFRAAPAWLAP